MGTILSSAAAKVRELAKRSREWGARQCVRFTAAARASGRWTASRLWPLLHATAVAIADRFRAFPLALLFLLTFAVTLYMNPVKAGPMVYGVAKVALGAYLGYWADRLCFRGDDRPHLQQGIARGTAWKRRALIVAAGMLGVAWVP